MIEKSQILSRNIKECNIYQGMLCTNRFFWHTDLPNPACSRGLRSLHAADPEVPVEEVRFWVGSTKRGHTNHKRWGEPLNICNYMICNVCISIYLWCRYTFWNFSTADHIIDIFCTLTGDLTVISQVAAPSQEREETRERCKSPLRHFEVPTRPLEGPWGFLGRFLFEKFCL